MKPNTATASPLLLASFFLAPLTTATFSLNISGPDWSYTAEDLAPTTSLGCQTAYSAPIDCDYTLVGLVASMRPAFNPDSTDLDNTCTTACSNSLAAYVKGVEAACTAPGDKAQESPGGSDSEDYILDPVQIVGQLFQYVWAQSCRKAANGTYCSLGNLAYAETGIPCDDQCAMSFYTNAHEMPASYYMFNYYWLVSRGDWWEDEFAAGWGVVQQCADGGNETSAVSNSGTASETITIDLTSSSALSTLSQSGRRTTNTGPASTSALVSASVTSGSTSFVLSSTTAAAKPTASPNSGIALKAVEVSDVVACMFVLAYGVISM